MNSNLADEKTRLICEPRLILLYVFLYLFIRNSRVAQHDLPVILFNEQVAGQLFARVCDCRSSFDRRVFARSLLDRIFQREVESTRTIAVLHWVDGMTLEEVANEVGLSVSGVRKRLRTLREHVGTLEGVGHERA